MNRKDRIDAMGATLLVGFSALLGLNQALVKLVNVGMSPVFQAGMRSAAAFLPVLIYAWIRRRKLTISDGSLLPGIVTGLLFAFEFFLLFKALDLTTVAHASILFYTMPVWVAVAAHFLIPGERMTRRRAFGLALAVAGVAVALAANATNCWLPMRTLPPCWTRWPASFPRRWLRACSSPVFPGPGYSWLSAKTLLLQPSTTG